MAKFSQEEREELLKTMSDLVRLSGRKETDDKLKKIIIYRC